jgi:polyisoprenoid-binding protein YceI
LRPLEVKTPHFPLFFVGSAGMIETAAHLATLLDSDSPPLLVDVSLPERFRAAHIPGAANACVFVVNFLDEVAKLAADPSTPIVVYGSSEASLASADAAEKLRRAGYEDVTDFRGGLRAWAAAGRPVDGEGEPEPAPAPPAHDTLAVDPAKSTVRWVGRNLAGRHHGEVAVREGEVTLENGVLAGGRVVLDMTAMTCGDIQDSKMNRILIAHLESDDFFDTERFPEAVFEIESVEPIADAPDGTPNVECFGSLTMRGMTNPVAFRATTGRTGDGGWVAQAQLWIDRTEWGVNYGSGRLYEFLGMHLVNDHVSLDLTITAG